MLKVIVKNIEEVSEELRGLYKESTDRDGNVIWVLQVEGVNTHPDVVNLRNAHEAQKTRNRDLLASNETMKARLEGLPDDFDGDAYDELKRAADAKPGDGKPDPAELERLVADRVAKATKKAEEAKAEQEARAKTYRDKLHARERDLAIDEALTEAGVTDPIYRKAARAMQRDRFEVIEEEDGTYAVVANDPDLGIAAPAKEFIKNWADSEEGKAFVGARDSGGGGAGGSGGKGPDTGPNPWKRDTLNLTEQARIESTDPKRAERLKAAAGVK